MKKTSTFEKIKDIAKHALKKQVRAKHIMGEELEEDEQIEEGTKKSVIDQFLRSKGLDPRFSSRYKKAGIGRSGELHTWKKLRGLAKEEVEELDEKDPCWDGYKQLGMKKKGGKQVPNCVPTKEDIQFSYEYDSPKGPQNGGQNNKSVDSKDKVKKKLDEPDSDNDTQPEDRTGMSAAYLKSDVRKNKPIGTVKEYIEPEDMRDSQGTLVREKKLSKTAGMIKDVVKKKLKEEGYDVEKADKDNQSGFSKKPNPDMIDGKQTKGKVTKFADAVLSGGKTVSGEPRDTIELDPLMLNRPDQTNTKPEINSKTNKNNKEQ